jgi:hypothetical protein
MGNPALEIEYTNEQIISECESVWHSFLRFVLLWCWIEDKESQIAIPFNLWDSQRNILPKFLREPLLIILKARQLGLTWLCAAYALWLCITRPMQLVVVISAKEEWAVEFLERVKFIMRRLPGWMYPDVDKDGGQHLSFVYQWTPDRKPLVISEIKSLATTVEGAQSKTPTLLILDETSRNRYIRQIWGASKPGIDAAGGRIIVISNSIKDGVGWSWTRGIYQDSIRGLNNFQRVFMPWWDRPDRMTDAEAKQLKLSDGKTLPTQFRANQIADGYDPRDFTEHYPATEAEAIATAGGSYFGDSLTRHTFFPDGITGRIAKVKGEDEYMFQAAKGGILELWRHPYSLIEGYDDVPYTHRYAIGSDVSEGLGASWSVAYVMDRLTQELIARLRGNRVDAYTWGTMLHALSQYYENALLCVEITGAGQTTVKRLKDLNANQYVRLQADRVGSELTKKYGWQETNQSKHELSGDLRQWLKKGTAYCPILIDECSTWIIPEGSTTIGPEGGHYGDCVIAAGLTIQADLFVGVAPKRIEPEPTGWLPRWKKEGGSAWTT